VSDGWEGPYLGVRKEGLFEQITEQQEGANMGSLGRAFFAEGTASAKALRKGWSW
jgi:hypothetical protein